MLSSAASESDKERFVIRWWKLYTPDAVFGYQSSSLLLSDSGKVEST